MRRQRLDGTSEPKFLLCTYFVMEISKPMPSSRMPALLKLACANICWNCSLVQAFFSSVVQHAAHFLQDAHRFAEVLEGRAAQEKVEGIARAGHVRGVALPEIGPGAISSTALPGGI
jgi:hypothetical protein